MAHSNLMLLIEVIDISHADDVVKVPQINAVVFDLIAGSKEAISEITTQKVGG